MAINNLSGNFQPPSETSGRSLPSPSSRAPSTNSQISDNEVPTVTKLEPKEVANPNVTLNPQQAEKQDEAISQIEEFKNFNQSIDRSLQFKVDEELGVTIVRVIDKETDELVRQFPPEELINLSKRLKELNEEGQAASGILLKEKV